MALSITVNGGGTFSASMEEGPVSFTATLGAVPGPKGDTGATGPAGVVAATAPITYDSGTQTVGISATPTFTSVTATTFNATNVAFADATTQTTAFVGEARKVYVIARNSTGSTIAKGKVVYLSGGTGNVPNVALALADSEATSARTIGITAEAISNNSNGKVIISGAIENIDTSAFSDGDTVYLSSSVAGGLQTTLPAAPLHGVVIGIVTRANPSVGSIEVAINNYQELKELSDVSVSDRANNDGLFWEASSSTWRSKTIAEVLGLTPIALTSLSASAPISYNSGTGAFTFDSSTFLLKADNLSGLASVSTARSNLGLGTMATETASNYLTTATASSTYLTQSNAASTYAPLASPAFTGNPTAPTPATSDNDTSVATTAFVNAYCPDASTTAAGKVELATDAEAIDSTSSTLVTTVRGSVLSGIETIWSPSIPDMTSAVSGLGASVSSTVTALNARLIAPNASTAGYATRGFNTYFNSLSANVGVSYNGLMAIGCNVYSAVYNGGNNTVFRAIWGRRSGTLSVPTYAVSERSFGFELEYKTTGAVVRVFAHDGTTLSTSIASFTPTNLRPFTAIAVKDGTTVRLYINGSEVASTTGGPSGNFASSANPWGQFEIVNDSTASAANLDVFFSNPKLIVPVV